MPRPSLLLASLLAFSLLSACAVDETGDLADTDTADELGDVAHGGPLSLWWPYYAHPTNTGVPCGYGYFCEEGENHICAESDRSLCAWIEQDADPSSVVLYAAREDYRGMYCGYYYSEYDGANHFLFCSEDDACGPNYQCAHPAE